MRGSPCELLHCMWLFLSLLIGDFALCIVLFALLFVCESFPADDLFNATIPISAIADGYTYDESTNTWEGTDELTNAREGAKSAETASSGAGSKRKRSAAVAFNRVLAKNPQSIAMGSVVTFRVAAVSHSTGVMSIHGTFVDERSPVESRAAKRVRAVAESVDATSLPVEAEVVAEEELPSSSKSAKKSKKEKKAKRAKHEDEDEE